MALRVVTRKALSSPLYVVLIVQLSSSPVLLSCYQHDPSISLPHPSYSNSATPSIVSYAFHPIYTHTHELKVTVVLSLSPALAFFTPAANPSTLRRTSTSRSSRTSMAAGKDATLYDFPVSNNGGRCRVVIYDKGIQDKVIT